MKLILTEKESVAKEFSDILGCKLKTSENERYYEGDEFVISWLYGHLLRMYEPGEYKEEWEKWNIEALPIIPNEFKNKIIDKPYIKKQFNLIKKLAFRNDIDTIINGGDCGIEGEGIIREVLLEIGVKKPVKRLWYDDMTEKEIKRALANMKDSSFYDGYYNAFLVRSRYDFLFGLNMSRLYTKKCTSEGVLSVGRCQTPLLNLIVQRDLSIENFKSESFFTLEADFGKYKGTYIKDGESKLDKKKAEEIKTEIEGKNGTVSEVIKENKKVHAPMLMNLTDLKTSILQKTDLTEEDVEKHLQELYQKKKITSYPRTSAEHVTEALAEQFEDMLEALDFGDFKSVIEGINKDIIPTLKQNKRYVNNKKVSDHYALVPTLNKDIEKIYKDLNKEEKIIFDEIVYRFLAIFYEAYEYEATQIKTIVNNHEFISNAKHELKKGWKAIYSDVDEEKIEQNIDVEITKGLEIKAEKVEVKEGKTKAPSRYTNASLLKTMKHFNLGTEATRKEIKNSLLKRDYIMEEGKKLISTKLGRYLINNIEIEDLKRTETTAKLEETLNSIIFDKQDYQEVYNEFVEVLKSNIELVKNQEIEGIKKEVLGKCPLCGGDIVRKASKSKEGKVKYFFGCSNYKEKECKFTIPEVINSVKLKDEDIKNLLEKEKTGRLKGKEYDFYLMIKEDGSLAVKGFKAEPIGLCPLCKKGNIVEKKVTKEDGKQKTFFGCTEYKNGCGFVLSKKIKGAVIKKSDIKKLTEKEKTGKLKGDEFEFYVIINDGKVLLKKA